jgi:hypothetical protein
LAKTAGRLFNEHRRLFRIRVSGLAVKNDSD